MKCLIICLLVSLTFITHGVRATNGWFWVGDSSPWVWSHERSSWLYLLLPGEHLDVRVEGQGPPRAFPIKSPTWVHIDDSFPWLWSMADDTFLLAVLPQGILRAYNVEADREELIGLPAEASQRVKTAQDFHLEHGLSATLFGIWQGERPLVTAAFGQTMTDEPVTESMHFRAGGASINVLISVLLQAAEVDDLSLDDTLDNWLPDLPMADQVTLRMLANCTAGFDDYVFTESFQESFYDNVFRSYTPEQLIAYGMAQSPVYEPGSNWAYSHTNFIIIGEVLQRVYNQPVATLMRERVLDPLDLSHTQTVNNPHIPAPVLHAFTTERGVFEDSTYWNPSWTSHSGQLVSTLRDLGRLARGVFSPELISADMIAEMVAPDTVGLGSNTPDRYYGMGLGVVNGWYLQNPNMGGYQAVMAYQPSTGTTLVVVCTLGKTSSPEIHHAMLLYQILMEQAMPRVAAGG